MNIMDLDGVFISYTKRQSFFRHSKFMALKDVSFSILKGETLGVIGRNGSGKSTLLRVLAGIYKADRGRITRHCKRISLLSLSLGFDPELTGRQNAILSGMLFGARKNDVFAKLNNIIEFSELDSMIDEPIKTYSSGMRARLGFSIALEMQVELLLIDEVMGVGDLSFRKKAEAAMMNKINSEQTVVLVSHSLAQIRRLCNRVIWLDRGRVRFTGSPKQAISEYQLSIQST